MIDDINYQLNFSIYVATGGHCYATLIKTDIHLIAFDRLVSEPSKCLKSMTFREGCFVIRN